MRSRPSSSCCANWMRRRSSYDTSTLRLGCCNLECQLAGWAGVDAGLADLPRVSSSLSPAAVLALAAGLSKAAGSAGLDHTVQAAAPAAGSRPACPGRPAGNPGFTVPGGKSAALLPVRGSIRPGNGNIERTVLPLA